MTHAAVVQVVLDPSADLAHRHSVLEQFVLPELTAMPGYRRSTWLNDGAGAGTCVVVFDTAAQAQAGLAALTREGGPEVTAAGVHAVEAEA
jgi:hypothetical protein